MADPSPSSGWAEAAAGSRPVFCALATSLVLVLAAVRATYLEVRASSSSSPRAASGKGAVSRASVLLFSVLSAASLGLSCRSALVFLSTSYASSSALAATPPHLDDLFAPLLSPARVRAEAWLTATPLHVLAVKFWANALDSPVRAWWTIQTFPLATAWALWLGLQGGARRRWRSATIALLVALGLGVSLGFAMNVSFAGVAAAGQPDYDNDDVGKQPKGDSSGKTRGKEESRQEGGKGPSGQKKGASTASTTAVDEEDQEMLRDDYGDIAQIKYHIDPVDKGQSYPDAAVYMVVCLIHFVYSGASMSDSATWFALPLVLLHVNTAVAAFGMTRAKFFVRNPRSLLAMIIFNIFAVVVPFTARLALTPLEEGAEGLGVGVVAKAVLEGEGFGLDVVMCWISLLTWVAVGDGS